MTLKDLGNNLILIGVLALVVLGFAGCSAQESARWRCENHYGAGTYEARACNEGVDFTVRAAQDIVNEEPSLAGTLPMVELTRGRAAAACAVAHPREANEYEEEKYTACYLGISYTIDEGLEAAALR